MFGASGSISGCISSNRIKNQNSAPPTRDGAGGEQGTDTLCPCPCPSQAAGIRQQGPALEVTRHVRIHTVKAPTRVFQRRLSPEVLECPPFTLTRCAPTPLSLGRRDR